MLDSVESLTRSVSVAEIWLKSLPPDSTTLIVPWRRRSRTRRILHTLRSIRRVHYQLQLTVRRQHMDIYVGLRHQQDLSLFDLMWPQDVVGWHRITDPIIILKLESNQL
jgi:hypothetical protein